MMTVFPRREPAVPSGRFGGGCTISRAALAACLVWLVGPAAAQPPSAANPIQDLRSPDPKARVHALRALRQTGDPAAAAPVAALLADPVDDIQLEALETELAFFLTDPPRGRRFVAGIVEVRRRAGAEAAFEAGLFAVVPRKVPQEVVAGLLVAARDEHPRVRLEAIYAVGVLAESPAAEPVVKPVADAVRHADPRTRLAAVRVLGRLLAPDPRGTANGDATLAPSALQSAGDLLIHAMNDEVEEVRLAAMRAVGESRDERAVVALSEQLEYFDRGPAAAAALEGLAQIGHASSLPIFRARLQDGDPVLRLFAAEGLGRAGDVQAAADLEIAVGGERSDAVRLAMVFALQRLGRPQLDRLIDGLDDKRLAAQAKSYLLEVGAPLAGAFHSFLQDPDPLIRAGVADVLGVIGGERDVAALERLSQDDSPEVAAAAERAVERIRLSAGRGR